MELFRLHIYRFFIKIMQVKSKSVVKQLDFWLEGCVQSITEQDP